jgi:peptidoglycan/LPS O-acetylase OafA/YrhL
MLHKSIKSTTIRRTDYVQHRREIDGLRAIAVVLVILFHAGVEIISGGFIGVDIFFVISGYLITSIISREVSNGTFTLRKFYERRVRRILPALILVTLASSIAAWFILPPSHMEEFSKSLLSVFSISSNVFFWSESNYFDTASELKPLLHTWSLSVEEQFYLVYPLLFLLPGIQRRIFSYYAIIILLTLSFLFAIIVSQYSSLAAFYLLPTRAWELLLGATIALYFSKPTAIQKNRIINEMGGAIGFSLLVAAAFLVDESWSFPVYGILPALGAALVIIFSHQGTLVGKLLSSKPLVGVGLISYSAYLWHQPLFAFARVLSVQQLSQSTLLALSAVTLVLAYISWHAVEQPFRNNEIIQGRRLYVFSLSGILLSVSFSVAGLASNGFEKRYAGLTFPEPWDPPVACHGAASLLKYEEPLGDCLGDSRNGNPNDIFLLGDSHAAQLSFPLSILAKQRGGELFFINTENNADFPYSFFTSDLITNDRLFDHVLRVADRGDTLVVTFHRGHLNESRDNHLPLSASVPTNEKYHSFLANMHKQIPMIVKAGISIILVKDTPLLSDVSSIEACAIYAANKNVGGNLCSVRLMQDLHTRERQSQAFEALARDFPDVVETLDPAPYLYRGDEVYSPLNPDGTYRMFDRHHLTRDESLVLLDMFLPTHLSGLP